MVVLTTSSTYFAVEGGRLCSSSGQLVPSLLLLLLLSLLWWWCSFHLGVCVCASSPARSRLVPFHRHSPQKHAHLLFRKMNPAIGSINSYNKPYNEHSIHSNQPHTTPHHTTPPPTHTPFMMTPDFFWTPTNCTSTEQFDTLSLPNCALWLDRDFRCRDHGGKL